MIDKLVDAGLPAKVCCRVLGVGVAIPDEISRIALPGRSPEYDVWADLDVMSLLEDSLPWPVHVDNDAAAAALGEAQCGTVFEHPSFFYLLISVGLGGGPVFDRAGAVIGLVSGAARSG